jgi:p-cumate 2,3-dioxygenase alpha subunit
VTLGNGHAVDILTGRGGGTRPIAQWHPVFGEETRDEIHRTRERLVERYGEERAYLMCNTSRLMLLYPNFALHDIAAVSMRYFEPVAPDLMELTVQTLAPRGESAELLNRRLENFLSFLGPAGFAHPDDVEALESAQLGYTAGGPEWIDVSKGMHRPQNTSMDEAHIRSFWRQWHANVMGMSQAGRVDDLVAAR